MLHIIKYKLHKISTFLDFHKVKVYELKQKHITYA
jgi:hypothetical protein